MQADGTFPEIDTSIVIATCSRLSMLRDALASLLAEAEAFNAPVEFVIVDDGSSDGTANFLAEWVATVTVPVRVLIGPRAGVAAARNVGSFAARGKWLASFDDDQIAQSGWLRALRALAEEREAALVGGALRLQLSEAASLVTLGPRARKLLGEHVPWAAAHRYLSGVLPATNNVLIRKDVFESLGGYGVAFTEGGEDKDFFDRVQAAGHVAWHQPLARALHVTPARRLERSNLRWTAMRVGAGDARVDRRARHPAKMLVHAGVRVVLALLRDVPQWIFAALHGSEPGKTDALCSLWYTSGYLRAWWSLHRGEGSTFMRSLNFRERNGERPQ